MLFLEEIPIPLCLYDELESKSKGSQASSPSSASYYV